MATREVKSPVQLHNDTGAQDSILVRRAEALREKGWSYRQIGEALGVSPTTALRWTNDEQRRLDRERTRKWKQDNAERRAAYEKARYLASLGPCVECGQPRSKNADRCSACVRARWHKEAEEIRRLWAEGVPLNEIAAILNTTKGSLGVRMHRLRAAGWDLPFRRARLVAA